MTNIIGKYNITKLLVVQSFVGFPRYVNADDHCIFHFCGKTQLARAVLKTAVEWLMRGVIFVMSSERKAYDSSFYFLRRDWRK